MKKKPKKLTPRTLWMLLLAAAGLFAVIVLVGYKLGSLMPGLNAGEVAARNSLVGLHGIYHNPLQLPINALRSLDFKFFHPTTNILLRLPNSIIGGLTIIAFYILLKLWYSTRIAIAGGALFASSAWVLHVNRLASYNVDYLAGVTFFLLSTAVLHKYSDNKYVHSLINLLWGLLIYIPGMVWLVAINAIRQHKQIATGFKKQNDFLSACSYILSIIIPLPLIVYYLTKSPKNIFRWLGLPTHMPAVHTLVKQFFAVFVHIFVRGPQYSNLWLGRQPILDIFCLVALVLGIVFYLSHLKATRTQLLIGCSVIGTILITLGGVDLSFLIPIVFLLISAGIAYLLQQWLSVFPKNPIARATGYILVVLAIALSCLYGVRSYFVAWPHDPTAKAAFDKKLTD